ARTTHPQYVSQSSGPGGVVALPGGFESRVSRRTTGFFCNVRVNSSNNLLGFETANASGWASQFQSGPESLYFSLSRRFPGFDDDFRRWSANATALTTVPLPGAVYLLGSAFAGLFFGAPKRKAGPL
ncbi:MAG: hypothetical protein ACREXS_06730, partial [Gammaproteobacteria bacterium]